MKKKSKIEKVIASIKNQKQKLELNPKFENGGYVIDYTKPIVRERDMRREAKTDGAYGSDYLGDA